MSIASVVSSEQPVVATFSTLLRQVVDANPLVATLCYPLVQHLCTILPLNEAQFFWPLLMRLRTA
jgi:hypothetical protein